MTDMRYAGVNRGLVLLSERDRLLKLLASFAQARDNVPHEQGNAPDAVRARSRLDQINEMLKAMGISF